MRQHLPSGIANSLTNKDVTILFVMITVFWAIDFSAKQLILILIFGNVALLWLYAPENNSGFIRRLSKLELLLGIGYTAA